MTTAQTNGFAAFETWLGTPLPADPIEAMRTLRREAAQEIERLLAFLDATDGDPDLEGELAGFEAVQDGRENDDTDAEPSLVFMETDYSIEEVSAPVAVNGYIQSFERACDAALEPEDTTVYLEKLAKRME